MHVVFLEMTMKNRGSQLALLASVFAADSALRLVWRVAYPIHVPAVFPPAFVRVTLRPGVFVSVVVAFSQEAHVSGRPGQRRQDQPEGVPAILAPVLSG